MKYLKTNTDKIIEAERWDYSYHESPVLLKQFDYKIIKKVSEVADIVKLKKDPTRNLEETFQYIDISSVNVETGVIEHIQELTGAEAPSRARKLVQAYDIIISTCRPTRRAIAVIPEYLHGQICSTGFSVIRAKENMNPLYLHFALRLDSTMEQFKKFATGSSYPAILDSDVEKTLIPIPTIEEQNNIVKRLILGLLERDKVVKKANHVWSEMVDLSISQIQTKKFDFSDVPYENTGIIYSNVQILNRISCFPVINSGTDDEQLVMNFDSLLDME